MSLAYKVVQWNRHKVRYDAMVALGVALFVLAFFAVSKAVLREAHGISDEVLILRALGTAGAVLLHIVLCIGPLARLDPRFAALLYNRRHLGVCTFLVALIHAAVSTGYYGAFGVRFPVLALLDTPADPSSLSGFPFEWLGLGALLILFVMAATSHDFWLANLGSRAWKWLHMLVYVAYALLVGHVALGALQSERQPWLAAMLIAGVVLVSALHVAAALRTWRAEAHTRRTPELGGGESSPWIDAGPLTEIPVSRARVVCAPGGPPIAVFNHDGRVSAISGTCAHQGGPLGEGKIVNGCVTCPWHGYQYVPETGASPPPYTEQLATYAVRVVDGRVMVSLRAEPHPKAARNGPEAPHG